jgi:hypothetical protein
MTRILAETMVPWIRRGALALALGGVLGPLVIARSAYAIAIVCVDPSIPGASASNTALVCTTPAGTCNVVSDFTATDGCDLDFGNRDVVFAGQFDVNSAFLTVKARTITVQRRMNARTDTDQRGGAISLTATGDGTTAHPGDIVISGRVEVTGNPAGVMRLTAAGKIDLQSTIPLVANGNQTTAVAGAINLNAGTAIRQVGQVLAAGGNGGGGGEIFYVAGTNIDVLNDIDASGGVNDGGDVTLTAGDDITIAQPINVESINGGNGGSISARAGVDALGGVKIGGALSVTSTLLGDGGSDVDAGYDGADIALSAFGPIAISGAIHATGGVPDGSSGTLGRQQRRGAEHDRPAGRRPDHHRPDHAHDERNRQRRRSARHRRRQERHGVGLRRRHRRERRRHQHRRRRQSRDQYRPPRQRRHDARRRWIDQPSRR